MSVKNVATEFPVEKIKKQLKDINKKRGIESDAAIHLIVNEMLLYNQVLQSYNTGDVKKVYLISQLSGQLFKSLKEFNILPSSKFLQKNTDDDGFDN